MVGDEFLGCPVMLRCPGLRELLAGQTKYRPAMPGGIENYSDSIRALSNLISRCH